MLSACMLLSLSLAIGAEDAGKSDAEVFSAALDAARAARIAELERELDKGQATGKKIAALKNEIKKLKDGKAFPPIGIQITSPKPNQIGPLSWDLDKETSEYESKKCTVERIIGKSQVLIQTSWTTSVVAVARSFSQPTASGFAPSRKLGENHHAGPSLLLSGIDASGLAEGAEWKPDGVFFVEGTKRLNGETVFVLRKLNVPGKRAR